MQRKIGLDPERVRALIDKPHDALFRALISDPARADALIRAHFPAPLRHLLEDTRARPGFVGQVDAHLRQAFADGVFELGGCPGMPKLVVPTEHKRAPRPEVVDQLADYTLGNRRRWKEVGVDPEIVPMLVTPDPAPTRAAWVGSVNKRGLRRLHMRPLRVECLWLAIAEHRYEALCSMASVRAVLGAMGCAYVEPAPLRTIRKVFRDLAGLPPGSSLWGMTYLYGLYTFAVEEDNYHALIRESETGEREAEMATMFQQQMAERDELRVCQEITAAI